MFVKHQISILEWFLKNYVTSNTKIKTKWNCLPWKTHSVFLHFKSNAHCVVLAHRLTTLSSMSASDELDDSQVRQMLFDLESAYNAFNRFLHSS